MAKKKAYIAENVKRDVKVVIGERGGGVGKDALQVYELGLSLIRIDPLWPLGFGLGLSDLEKKVKR